MKFSRPNTHRLVKYRHPLVTASVESTPGLEGWLERDGTMIPLGLYQITIDQRDFVIQFLAWSASQCPTDSRGDLGERQFDVEAGMGMDDCGKNPDAN